MTILGLLLVCLGVLVSVHGQEEYCCSPDTFESDLTISGSLLGVNLKLTSAKLSVDQTQELIAMRIYDERGFLTLFKTILDFPGEKVYIVIPLLGNLCLVSNSSYPFTRSCATEGNTLLETGYLGSGEVQLPVQTWDKNKPNVTHTQVRTEPTPDGTCYLVSENFQATGFSMTLGFTNMIAEVDGDLFIPPSNCIDSYDLLNEDSDRIPAEVRVLLTRGLDFY